MKSFLLASVGLVALVGIAAPASAADMAVKARPPAPVIAPIYDWTGFYIGGMADGARAITAGISLRGWRCLGRGLPRPFGRPLWWSDRLSLASQSVGIWPGSPRRLGGSQQLARQPARSLVSTRTKTDGIGLFTGQIGYAWNAALLYVKGGAAVTSNRFSILATLPALNWPQPARRVGAAPSVSDLSMALRRTGRSVLNTTICSWAMPIIRSRSSIRC